MGRHKKRIIFAHGLTAEEREFMKLLLKVRGSGDARDIEHMQEMVRSSKSLKARIDAYLREDSEEPGLPITHSTPVKTSGTIGGLS
jgi:hypothetical protein